MNLAAMPFALYDFDTPSEEGKQAFNVCPFLVEVRKQHKELG